MTSGYWTPSNPELLLRIFVSREVAARLCRSATGLDIRIRYYGLQRTGHTMADLQYVKTHSSFIKGVGTVEQEWENESPRKVE